MHGTRKERQEERVAEQRRSIVEEMKTLPSEKPAMGFTEFEWAVFREQVGEGPMERVVKLTGDGECFRFYAMFLLLQGAGKQEKANDHFEGFLTCVCNAMSKKKIGNPVD